MTEFFPSFLNDLLFDPELSHLVGTDADCAAMLKFEMALAEAEAANGLISEDAALTIVEMGATFAPGIVTLQHATLKDGVVVPEFVRELRDYVGGDASQYLHFGATSQDVIDTVLALKLKRVFILFESRLQVLLETLDGLVNVHGQNQLMGRTRMQAAIPITVADRLDVWRGLVSRAGDDLASVREKNLILSLAGPAGTSEKFGNKIDAVRNSLAGLLGLSVPDYVPHAARDRIATLGNWLSLVTGALGKIGQDIALMAQNEIAEIALEGGGGSSAMAHKQNPVRAEVLVSLARFNAVQVSGLHQALVHEQERSGAAWTLEWLILPQMLNATGTALTHAQALLDQVRRIGSAA
ncbi:MAG: 3-carboxy-cis,cis-muconate cycloisomerase [Rhizobium sp.]|nr:3-carboxy-cis,cis-muconate cycloisomerase [Rhizobium sp.]